MITPPQTAEQAAKYRYNTWAGEPKGQKYKPSQCAYECYAGIAQFYQCPRKPGHGPAGLYCKQHAKIVARRLEPST